MKYVVVIFKPGAFKSRPARALWIEISVNMMVKNVMSVEAREGLVD